jgi:ThiF family
VSLPRFLSRVVDATAPALGGLDRDAVERKLETTAVALVGGDAVGAGASRDGFLLAANLLARLYPRIVVVGPADVAAQAAGDITLINPLADVVTTTTPPTATPTLYYETNADDDAAAGGAEIDSVAVFARGWNVYVDEAPDGAAAASAALLAAVVGVGEVFRIVFADDLGERRRDGSQPGSFNLVTLGEAADVPQPERVDVSEVRLVGAGAIGQAVARTLAAAEVEGTLLVIDDESITLSNLQRYVLSRESDVGAVKVDLLRERLRGSPLEVVPLKTEWYAGLVEKQIPTLVAVDSPEDRIAVQASLPGLLYNAWTQPADVGWSRHEHFGEEPCLACLYWPDEQRPSQHEQIATAFRQHPLRALAYLVHRLPIGLPLPPGAVPGLPDLPAPPDADQWYARPLVDDIALAADIDVGELASWRDRPLADVYQDGICGGALLHLNVGAAPRKVLVPLAHQSAFAGIMLATELIVASVPALKALRPAAVEGRFDVLAGLPQVLARPRARTDGCLCGDAVWRDVYGGKFGVEAGEVT